MSILGIYLLGVVAAALHLVWFEYQFDHNKQLSNVTRKEWLQDAAISLFSWIAFVLAIIVTIWRFNGGKPTELYRIFSATSISKLEVAHYLCFFPLRNTKKYE